jgi:hypothetical protein
MWVPVEVGDGLGTGALAVVVGTMLLAGAVAWAIARERRAPVAPAAAEASGPTAPH